MPCNPYLAHAARLTLQNSQPLVAARDPVLAPYRSSDLAQPSPALLERFFGIHRHFSA